MASHKQFKLKIAFNHGSASEEKLEALGKKEGVTKEDTVTAYSLNERQVTEEFAGFLNPNSDAKSETLPLHRLRILLASSFLLVFFLLVAWSSVRFFPQSLANYDAAAEQRALPDNALVQDVLATPSSTSLSLPLEPQDLGEAQIVPASPEVANLLAVDGGASVDEKQLDMQLVDEIKAVAQADIGSMQAQTFIQVKVIAPEVVGLARLAPRLVNKQPQGEVANPVVLGPSLITRLYFSTRMQGVSGQVFYHVWSHEGVEKARIKLSVTSDYWRGNSSKYIDRLQVGAWKTRLESEAGKVLAKTEFEVVL